MEKVGGSEIRCVFFKLNTPKLAFRPPRTPLWELTALPSPLAGFQGPTSKRRGGHEREGDGKRKRRGGSGKGDGREYVWGRTA